MPDTNPIPGIAPPSASRLLRSTLLAAIVAAVLLVTIVMPAEYGIDPTGVGRLLGLTRMGEIKVSLATEAAQGDVVTPVAPAPALPEPARPEPAPAVMDAPPDPLMNSHVSEVVLAPNEGKEIKLVMRKDARVTFSWSTDRGAVNYDTHADAPGIKYHGYGKGSGKKSDEGVLVAAFDGSHGWFWRNRGSETVTVTLTTTGEYVELKRL